MLGYYNISVVLTYIGLVSSVIGMRYAMIGRPIAAVVCLLICGVCDMFDGTIARATKRSEEAKTFGIQIDSLCDLCGFGVLPSVILLSENGSALGIAVACLFTLDAVIRLGYFNVHEQIRQQTSTEDKSEFHGLPVTSAAWLLPMLFAFRGLMGAAFAPVFTGVMLVIAVLFIVDFRLKKPKNKRVMYAGGAVWFLAIIAALILFS